MSDLDTTFYRRVADGFKLQRLPFVTLAEAVRDVESWLTDEIDKEPDASYNLTWLNPSTRGRTSAKQRFHLVLTHSPEKFQKISTSRNIFEKHAQAVFDDSIGGDLEERCFKRIKQGLDQDPSYEEAITYYTAIFQLIYSFNNPVSAIPGRLHQEGYNKNIIVAHVRAETDQHAGLPLFDIYSFENENESPVRIKTGWTQCRTDDPDWNEAQMYQDQGAYRWVKVIEGSKTDSGFRESWDVYVPIHHFGRFLGYLVIGYPDQERASNCVRGLRGHTNLCVKINSHLDRAYHRGMVGYILDGYGVSSDGGSGGGEVDPIKYWREQLCTWLHWEKCQLPEDPVTKGKRHVDLNPNRLKRLLQSSGGLAGPDRITRYAPEFISDEGLRFDVAESDDDIISKIDYLDNRRNDAVDLLGSLTSKWRSAQAKAERRVLEETSAIQHEVKHVVVAVKDRWMLAPDEIKDGLKEKINAVFRKHNLPIAEGEWKIAPIPSIYEKAARMLTLWTGTLRPWDIWSDGEQPESLDSLIRESHAIAKANLLPFVLYRWELDRDYEKAAEYCDLIERQWDIEVENQNKTIKTRFASFNDNINKQEYRKWVDLTRLIVACLGNTLLHGDPSKPIEVSLESNDEDISIYIKNDKWPETVPYNWSGDDWNKLKQSANSDAFAPFISDMKGRRVLDIYASKIEGCTLSTNEEERVFVQEIRILSQR